MLYDRAVWTAADISITFDEISEGMTLIADIVTPDGVLKMIGLIERFDRDLVVSGVHIQSENLGPNRLGWARVRQIALAVAEIADVDIIVVKGAPRTTGAVPGRYPGQLRFTRALRSAR